MAFSLINKMEIQKTAEENICNFQNPGCITLKSGQLLLLSDLILDREEANITTNTSMCMQNSESRVKYDLFLWEKSIIRIITESRQNVSEDNVEDLSGNEYIFKWLKYC